MLLTGLSLSISEPDSNLHKTTAINEGTSFFDKHPQVKRCYFLKGSASWKEPPLELISESRFEETALIHLLFSVFLQHNKRVWQFPNTMGSRRIISYSSALKPRSDNFKTRRHFQATGLFPGKTWYIMNKTVLGMENRRIEDFAFSFCF